MGRKYRWIVWANHTMGKLAEYIAMCTQLKVSSPWRVCDENIQGVLNQSDGRGHGVDQSQHGCWRVCKAMRTKQLNKLKKIGGNKFDYFESFKRKGGSAKPGIFFLIFRSRRIVGLEDTGEIKRRSRAFAWSRISRSKSANRFAELDFIPNFCFDFLLLIFRSFYCFLIWIISIDVRDASLIDSFQLYFFSFPFCIFLCSFPN